MRIKKVEKQKDYVQVQNSFLRDDRISFKAKGLFSYMFSMNDNWNFTIKSIATQQDEGVASISSAMNELKEFGFIIYEKYSDGSGTYILDDEPKLENPDMDNPIMRKSKCIKEDKLDKNTNSKQPTQKSNNNKLFNEYLASKETTKNEESLILDYLVYRKDIKKPITTIRPLNTYYNVIIELHTKGYDIKKCIELMKNNEWQKLDIEWIKNSGLKSKSFSKEWSSR